MVGRDDDDPWSRDRGPRYAGGPIRVGLPAESTSWSSSATTRCGARTWRSASTSRARTTVVDVSLEPFLAAGSLLYQGPWVAERLVEFGDFLAAQPESIHPVVRDIFRGGHRYTAVDAFAALQRLQELKAAGRPAVARDGRAGGADHRHHVHRRRGAGRADRLQHDARPLHPLRQSARPARRRGSARRHRRRAAVQRDAARQRAQPTTPCCSWPRRSSTNRASAASARHRQPPSRSPPRSACDTDHRGTRRTVAVPARRGQDRADRHRHATGLPAARRVRRKPRQRRRPAAQGGPAAGRADRGGPRGGRHGDPHPRRPPARPVGLPARQAQPRRAVEAHRRPGQVRPHPDPRRVRPRHRRRTRPDRRRGRHRQARQGRVLRHRAVRTCSTDGGHHPAAGHRRHHRGVRAHHHPRGQRPRIRVPRRIRLRRFVFPGIPAHRPGDDQGAGRHLRLGRRHRRRHPGAAATHHHPSQPERGSR